VAALEAVEVASVVAEEAEVAEEEALVEEPHLAHLKVL